MHAHDIEKTRDRKTFTQLVGANDQYFGELICQQDGDGNANPQPVRGRIADKGVACHVRCNC